jgi:FkbM family methyltransferase
MTFISYAQNFEDVMLWRALKHVKSGFYIDAGAWSPEIDSVTRHFYENGWRGINIEPNSEFHAQYAIKRQRDINLEIAVGEKKGELIINFISAPGLSTEVKEFARQHTLAGWENSPKKVRLDTLANICRENIPQGQEIHFLKVDVEGLEEAVLRGNDWVLYRPWIVLVEATLPMTQTESFAQWEPILLNENYTFAFADGLNRFYVANEHDELIPAFKYPPNVFDDFVLNSQEQAKTEAEQAKAEAEQAKAEAQQAKAEAQQAKAEAQQAKAEAQQAKAEAQQAEFASHTHIAQLHAVYNNTSWRVTAPLRWLFHQLRLMHHHGFKQRAKAAIKKGLRVVVSFFVSRPKLKGALRKVSSKLGLLDRLRSTVLRLSVKPQATFYGVGLEDLTPGARKVYQDVKLAIANKRKGGE